MKPISFIYSGPVAAPIEKVFELLTDPHRFTEWLPYCAQVEPAQRPNGRGARHLLVYETLKRRVTIEIEIADFTPPTGYGWVELAQRAGSKTFFLLQFAGGVTKVTMKQSWTPRTWRAWVLGQIFRRRNAQRMFNAILQNFRKLLTK
ncbi:MAG TPA: SRPBCC family protein [Gemmatimonadales bacterium]|nr:SRPBCC family protein [Gemmatimonadales bacterium]